MPYYILKAEFPMIFKGSRAWEREIRYVEEELSFSADNDEAARAFAYKKEAPLSLGRNQQKYYHRVIELRRVPSVGDEVVVSY